MSYPFSTFPITKKIGIVNPAANLDARYGPWATFNDALTAFDSVLREVGLTVAISGADGITEYWYKNGTTNNDLILKSATTNLYQNLTGNWQSTYITVSTLSAQWGTDSTTDTAVRDLTGNWQSTYITVSSLSAQWEESADIVPTVTNYLSTNSVILCSIDVKNQILSAGTDLFNIFLTQDLDSQTLTYESSSYKLSISNGNTVNLNLSSILTSPSATATFLTVSATSLSGTHYGDGSNLTGVEPATQIRILTENENTLSADGYSIYFKTVSSDNAFVFSNFNSGQTITLYLSANHGTIKRHTLPSPTYLSNVSEANEIYTYNGYITKTTIQCIGNEYYGISNIIKTDTTQNPGIIGRLVLDQSSDFLVQENSDRLLL